MTRRYLTIYESGPTNLSGFAPDVPGCASTGHTLEEMRRNLREAIEFHLEGLALDGQPLPVAKTRLVEVPEDGFAEWLHVELPVAEAVSAYLSGSWVGIVIDPLYLPHRQLRIPLRG